MLIYNFMFAALPGSPTGLAKAVLNRTKGFEENGFNSLILAPAFNRYHKRDMELLRKKELLKVPVHYMFEDLSTSNENYISSDPVLKLVKEENLTMISDNNSSVKRLFDNGVYKYFVKYSSEGVVNFIKHFSDQVFVDSASFYNENNVLVYKEFYFPNSNALLSKVYYDANGEAFLRYLYKKSGELYNIIHFPSDHTFSNEQELVFFWLKNILPMDEQIMLISEYAVYKKALLEVKKVLTSDSKLIFTLHNNHFSKPYDIGSPIRNDFKTLLNHLDDLKNIVVLTQEQQQDLIDQFGHPDSFFYVPHAAESINHNGESQRIPYTITVGSRFEKIKGIEETIRAFSKVVKKLPDAHLNIIGRGVERKNYEALIKELNIESSCSIINFVNNLPMEYAESDISVFTSYYEGFHLSLIEAMSAGAVPVVFPYKYGPKDIIENGKSGIITKEKDISELADSIIELLMDRVKLTKMRKESMKISSKYSVTNNVKCWKKVFSNAN